MVPVSMLVYWIMIFWLKQSDTCVNGGLLNDDILIKTKWWKLKKSDTCVNSGLLNDDTLIKTNLEIKTKWYLTNVSIVVYWMMIFWLKQMCQRWFIEWWYFD